MIHDQSIIEIGMCYSYNDKGAICWFHDKFGSFLINTLHIYSKDENIYIYKNGIYVRNENDILRAIQFYCKDAKDNFRKEVYKYIQISAPVITQKDNVNLIGCQNGVFNIETNEITNFCPEYFLQHKISASYDSNAKSKVIDDMLDLISCNNNSIKSAIEEMIGYCLYRNCRYHKVFLLKGFGKNGKSTLLESIQYLIGEDNISALSLNDLQDKFKKAELQDKLLNVCDDLSNVYIKDTEAFKSIATGGVMTMERKQQTPFKYKNMAKLIMCANDIPKSADKTDGYYRRFYIIPLNANISKDTCNSFDPNFTDKLNTEEAKSYLLKLAIDGLKRLIARGEFEDIDLVKNELEEYKEDNDPIVKFINDKTLDYILGKTTDHIYSSFNSWYEYEYNRKSDYNKTTISRTLARMYSVTTSPRSQGRVYVLSSSNSSSASSPESNYTSVVTDKTENVSTTLKNSKCSGKNVVDDDDLPF